MIILEHLQKDFNGLRSLKDIDTVINDGDVVAVIGPSGAGKSTLLQCINLLIRPTKGRIIVDGTDITAPDCDLFAVRRKMGMVFQNYNLFEHLTVVENIMLAQTELMGKTRQQAYDKSMELLHSVGMAERSLVYPRELSGGQRQRTAIARTLAADPDIILFDEPTSALDHSMTSEVQSVIRDIAATGKTMVIVTNELALARAVCSRVLYIDDGIICEDGPPEIIFDSPSSEKTRRFIHSLKVLDLTIKSKDHDFLTSNAEIDDYCIKNRIPGKTTYHIQSVFEELCRQIIFPALSKPNISVTVEYSEADQKIMLIAEYGDIFFDPSQTDNDLAYTLLTGIAESVKYERIEGEYLNRVTVTIA